MNRGGRPRDRIQPGDVFGWITVEQVLYIDEPASQTVIVGRCRCGERIRNGRHNIVGKVRRGGVPKCRACARRKERVA